ncbi:MAG: hypothetical protein ABI190_10890 [Casimicrobiaceae bacterium]
MENVAHRIRIIGVPPGEAPLPIREAWVGLELPLASDKPRRYLESGVLSGPRSRWQTLIHALTFRLKVHTAYVVPSLGAIEILEKSRPAEARWWHDNVPRACRPKRNFLFATQCCQRIR